MIAARFNEIRARGGKFGVIGSNHTTNEENELLAKMARVGLGTENIDHHRTGDVAGLLATGAALARTADLYSSPAVLMWPATCAAAPFPGVQVRANWRHHQARVYTVRRGPVREDNMARALSRSSRVRSWKASKR